MGTISVMIKTIKLAAIMMVEHAVTILLIYGTSIAKTVNVRIQMHVCLHLVLMLNLKNGARRIARKLVKTAQNGNQSYFCPHEFCPTFAFFSSNCLPVKSINYHLSV